MKRILLSIFILSFTTLPCTAQWKAVFQGAWQVTAFGVLDTELFTSVNEFGALYFSRHGISPPFDSNWHGASGVDLSQGTVTSFASVGANFFVGVTPNNALVYKSTNNGANWQTSDTIGSPVGSNGSYLFAKGDYFDPTHPIDIYYLVRSRDTGRTWDSIASFNPTGFATLGTYIFASAGNALWRSTDTGNHWSQLSPPFVATMMTMGTRLFMYNPSIIESTDSGMTWTSVPVDSAGVIRNAESLVTDGKNLFAGSFHSLYVSQDAGASWKKIDDAGFASPNPEGLVLGVFDTTLFADVYFNDRINDWFYYRPISEIVSKSSVEAVSPPSRDSLAIYPNPARGLVTIVAGGTSIYGISVLNVLGVTVMEVPISRESEISIDVSKLPAGTYFFEIQTSNGPQVRKISIER